MLSVSENYSKAILADSRDMPYRVTLAGAIVLDQARVPNMTLEESASGSSEIALGTSNSATLKLTIRDADAINYNGMLVVPESGLALPDGTIEWLPLGKFWVTEFSTSNDYKTVYLTCADGMYHLTGEYESKLTYPTLIQKVVYELVGETGVELVEPDAWPEVIVRKKPDVMTYREAFGYVAGCLGKNARFNRDGKMEFFWYQDTGVTIGRDTQYLNGMTKLNDKPLKVNFSVTGAQETYTVNVTSDGNGGVTATPGTSVWEGDTVTLSVRPYSGYELATLTATTDAGATVTLYVDAEGGGYTFVQPDSNVNITASFRTSAEGPFELTVRAYDNGSISYSASGNEAGNSYFNEGDSVTIFVAPNADYQIDRFITTPSNITLTEVGTTEAGDTMYAFAMPQSDVTINAYFKEETSHYSINTAVDYGDTSITPGYIVIENLTTSGSEYNAGDKISVRFARSTGYVFDYYESNVEMTQVDNDEFVFTMPEENVSITAYFKWEEDESKAGEYSWLALPSNNTPPTDKPYWAVFYKEDWSVPTCQKFHLVWFDSWTVTGYETSYSRRIYSVQLNGYYHCGSKDTGHLPHAWDTSTWSGNGASGSTLDLSAYIGGHAWCGGDVYGSGDYCLLATNAHLYYNSTLIFTKCENAIQYPQTSYFVDDTDIREKESLTYWKCPDTFSTPAPASYWMIVEAGGSLCMTPDADGSGYSRADYCDGLYIVFFDDIAIENIGNVIGSSDEEFHIATLTNGHYCALKAEGSSTSWTLYDIADGDVIGLRSPLVSSGEKHAVTGSYYFSGILATSITLSSSGETLIYKNDCRVCDCASEATVMTFNLLRSAGNTDAIVIEADHISVTTEDDAVVMTSNMLSVIKEYDTLYITVGTTPTESEDLTLTYTNPLIYEKMVSSISSLVSDITYTPARVKYRGNPAFQAGDAVIVPDKDGVYHTVLIMQQTLTFGGGMNSEITCPGQTKQAKSFTANGPITSQIKQEVQQGSLDLERRLSANNALVFASLYRTIGDTEAKLRGVVEWQTEKAATISELELSVSDHEATIEAQAEILTETAHSLADLSARVDENGASIGLLVENNEVKGSIIIEAINEESTAKISADRLDIEGKTLNIKVDAANITGTLTIGQLPSTVAETSDIPTKTSDLTNDSGYQSKTGVTSIVKGVVTTDYVNALGITAKSIDVDDLSALGATIGGWDIDENGISKTKTSDTDNTDVTICEVGILPPDEVGLSDLPTNKIFYVRTAEELEGTLDSESYPFYVQADGYLHSEYGEIGGWNISSSGLTKTGTDSSGRNWELDLTSKGIASTLTYSNGNYHQASLVNGQLLIQEGSSSIAYGYVIGNYTNDDDLATSTYMIYIDPEDGLVKAELRFG